jgi:hypothetical protein
LPQVADDADRVWRLMEASRVLVGRIMADDRDTMRRLWSAGAKV